MRNRIRRVQRVRGTRSPHNGARLDVTHLPQHRVFRYDDDRRGARRGIRRSTLRGGERKPSVCRIRDREPGYRGVTCRQRHDASSPSDERELQT